MNAIVNHNSLIPVIEHEIDGELQPCVDARELHRWLKCGEMFSKWISGRIRKYGFTENEDFSCYWEFSQTQTKAGRKGKAKLKKYVLTLDMAKELSMVENNDQGRTARRYFINCEKTLRQASQSIQLEIGKAIQYFDQFNTSLSNAARFLSVGGKQTKPKLLSDLEKMIQKAQPQLPFDNKKADEGEAE